MHSSNTLGFALATVPFTDRQENGPGTVMVRTLRRKCVAKHAPKSGDGAVRNALAKNARSY